MEFKTLASPLRDYKYYREKTNKKRIILHHTAGGTAQSSVNWWNRSTDHVSTAFIIDRDGTVYQNFSPDYWAYALGVSGSTDIEKTSIQIEICSYGALVYDRDEFRPNKGSSVVIPFKKTVAVPFRDRNQWEAYTKEQVASVVALMRYLVDRYQIKIQPELEGFWAFNKDYLPNKLPAGIWSHTTVRKDKLDIFPQPSLIEAIYTEFGNKQ